MRRRRQQHAALSPRALARLRTPFVPRAEDLAGEVRAPLDGPPEEGGAPGSAAGRHRRVRPPRSRWVRRPAALVGARWSPARSAVAGVLAVVLLAAGVFGLRVAWARTADVPAVVAPGGPPRAGPTGLSTAAAAVGLPTREPAAVQGGAPETGAGEVVVHVVGEVQRPGVQRLPAGSRVAEAVAAAGGVTDRADLAGVNLARVLADGEQVRVPRPGEAVAPPAGGGVGDGGGPVPLNSADVAALDTLPGVGPVLAQRIVDWRTAHGRFTAVDELAEVSGIGEKLLAQLRPLVTT